MMMRDQRTFCIGDWVVYPMHGIGRVATIITRTMEGQPQRFYQVALAGKEGGEVLVPVSSATARGLRRALRAQEVPQAMQQLQRSASRQAERGKSQAHYTWCKERLRQGDALGLAEVRRFLHDLQHQDQMSNPHLRQLRGYVCTQLPAEIAHALGCPQDTADRIVDLALTSTGPIDLHDLF